MFPTCYVPNRRAAGTIRVGEGHRFEVDIGGTFTDIALLSADGSVRTRTPTEASIVAVCYTLLLGLLYREVKLERLRLAFVETARMTALVMYLTGIGSVMGFVPIRSRCISRMALSC
jgi:hypothetical protein